MNISTSAVLVSPGLAVKGTMSITASEVYFEVDEDNADYKKLEPQVRRFICTYILLSFILERCEDVKLHNNLSMISMCVHM